MPLATCAPQLEVAASPLRFIIEHDRQLPEAPGGCKAILPIIT